MAVVGRRDEQTAHTIALSDYRWVRGTDERSNSHMVLASSPACLFCAPMPDPLVDVPSITRTWAVSGGSKHHLSVCTIFKAQASDPQLGVQRFLEWLAYHETVGVQVQIDIQHKKVVDNYIYLYLYSCVYPIEARKQSGTIAIQEGARRKGGRQRRADSDWRLCDGATLWCAALLSL